MRLKGVKKQERAKKEAEKHLTASQRLAKFKNQKYWFLSYFIIKSLYNESKNW